MRYNKQLKHRIREQYKHNNQKLHQDTVTNNLEANLNHEDHQFTISQNIVASGNVGIFICLILDILLGFTFDTNHFYLYTIGLVFINCFLLFLIFMVSRNWKHLK